MGILPMHVRMTLKCFENALALTPPTTASFHSLLSFYRSKFSPPKGMGRMPMLPPSIHLIWAISNFGNPKSWSRGGYQARIVAGGVGDSTEYFPEPKHK